VFDEGRLYAPITAAEDGEVTVHLGDDHPGFADPEYRERRNLIAARALRWSPGEPIPRVSYTPEEHGVWRLMPLTGFRYHPAAGLVGFEDFYGSLADGVFHSTQYVRHHARPLYTPEPDLIHEVIGHGGLLAGPRLAELNRLAGHAARRLQTPAGRDFFAKIFWFTIEFGVVWEHEELRAYGAGLLSSYGEIDEFRSAEIRPLHLAEMGTLPYDITRYQPILYAADGLDHLLEVAGSFFAGCDDDSPARLGMAASVRAG
jgi:phenylalanine-4-hydroxylase